ncbi:MAG: dienelactone hydrolase family protein [Burkholderiales bacterium]|nr:dienelactone hydrolase family protein [Burkholderiales bacterium]MDE2274919.1 dienelactone hydrolase family protein [Burkholderiales bacterium]
MPMPDLPPGPIKRRDFIRTTLGSSFAAAVLPVSAQARHTSSDGLLVGEVTVPVGGFQMPAYRAAPAGRRSAPVVLVVSEIFGVHEHIADIARRLAHAGYFAVAPELFARQGDPGSYGEIGKLVSEVVLKVPDAQVLGDLDATLAWAAQQGADAGHAAITGFCWGGRITWLYAAHSPSLRAAVAWYGRLVGAPTPLQPTNPIDVAPALQVPVLGLYGGQDGGIPQSSIAQMKAALAGGSPAARQSEFVVYPQAGHAFNADYRNSYVADAADDGWRRCLAWLRAHGAAPSAR